ncbi:MAG: HIT family protein [Halioglobus sp.]
MDPVRVVAENKLAYGVTDAYPVTQGHALVIPKRHVADYFGLTEEELIACRRLILSLKSSIDESPDVEGFNIGANAGLAAGQTIFHCHFHLIPRRQGDVEEPKGGVRNAIPGMSLY